MVLPRDVREGGLRTYATIGHVTRPRSFTIIQKFAGPPRDDRRGAGATCQADSERTGVLPRARGATVVRESIERARSVARHVIGARLPARGLVYTRVTRHRGTGRRGRARDAIRAGFTYRRSPLGRLSKPGRYRRSIRSPGGSDALHSRLTPCQGLTHGPRQRTPAVRDFAHGRQTARESRPARQ